MKRFLSTVLLILPLALFAANFSNLPSEVTQPNGEVLKLFASGDEYANRLHDADGYTVIQSPVDGYFYYAVRSGDEPAPSQWRPGQADPRALGIPTGISISPAARQQKIQLLQTPAKRNGRGPNTGVVNNLNIFIRFSDQTEFVVSRGDYDFKFNAVGDTVISLRNYFHQVSYDQLDYVTHHFPTCAPEVNLSYQDSHPRSYYMPYNGVTNPNGYNGFDDRAQREQALLADAIAAITPQVPTTLNIDADNDGYVDNVCFIIRGPHSAWNDLLWAHRWGLYYEESFINGKMVFDFTFQPEDQNSVRTLCHEMFHSVGAPDLYHYDYDGITPAGCWDIMESGNGHMGMLMKTLYGGWLNSIPLATAGNTYTLNPVTSPTNSALRYNLPGSSQYLVFEYRKKDADIFESQLPCSGLLIYRIYPQFQGNADGPPDGVYIFRPNGSQTINGLIAEAAFAEEHGRTEFNAYTNPQAAFQDGSPIQVNVNGISAAGETISFTISSPTENLPPVIRSLSPASGSIVPNEAFQVSADVIAPTGTIDLVMFLCDGLPFQTDPTPPYSGTLDAASLSLGQHNISVSAHDANGLSTAKSIWVEVIDPHQPNWFDWLTDTPAWEEYGRGAVPIQAAIDLDLGDRPYQVQGLKFHIAPDPWGAPAIPGLVEAKINRFANGTIQTQTLMNLGPIYNTTYDPEFIYPVNDTTSISGQIAVILNLFEYQNMVFDTNAICGHSWITEPNRPWTDALGRGILGAASIQLLLQAPIVEADDPLAPAPITLNASYPNPFAGNSTLRYFAKEAVPTEIAVYDLRGRKVRTLLAETVSPGDHALTWDGANDAGGQLANGIYFYRVSSGGQVQTRKTVLLK